MSITSTDNIRADIKLFKTFKAVGTDGIPFFIIKGCSKIFVRLFAYIFNTSLTIHIFLSLSRSLLLYLLWKEGNNFAVNNYRPISFLNFSIIIEIIFQSHLTYLLQK